MWEQLLGGAFFPESKSKRNSRQLYEMVLASRDTATRVTEDQKRKNENSRFIAMTSNEIKYTVMKTRKTLGERDVDIHSCNRCAQNH